MSEIWYYRKLSATVLIVISTVLLLEHIWNWDGIELLDFIGHEWYAIVLFILGVSLAAKELTFNWDKQWDDRSLFFWVTLPYRVFYYACKYWVKFLRGDFDEDEEHSGSDNEGT
jgi:hypothetical protein